MQNNMDLAYIDDLTGLTNRRYLNTILPKEIRNAKEEGGKLSLFMIDYDGFKNVNDTYGHLIGDQVLVEIANILKQEIGDKGMLVRYAGDEFTVILPGQELKEALKIANNLLSPAAKRKVELKDGHEISNVTLSIGVAIYPDDADNPGGLIDKADQALYSSKRTGKNKVSTVKDVIAEVHDRNLLVNALPCKKFIDREQELKILQKAYDSAEKEVKKFILIEGEPGTGKTRLMLELMNINKTYPHFLLKCRRENLKQQYGDMADGLNVLLDSLEARGVLNAISSLDDVNKYALVSLIDKIKDLPIRYSTNAALSIKNLREEDIFAAFTNFIKALKFKMIPVMVDDILWIDKGSLKVINWILQENAGSNALIVGTISRRALRTQTVQKTPLTDLLEDEKLRKILEIIDLKPLQEDAVSEFLKSVFAGLLLPAGVERQIFRTSMGFPSNIEEMIKYSLDNKIICPKGGKWILDEKRIDMIPSSLKELFERRISELDSESKEILSKAAILGSDFDTEVLASFAGKNEGQVLDILDRLRDKGVLRQGILGQESVLSFVNNIIRENLYNAIERKQLQQLHRQVAKLLEKYYQSEMGKVYGKLGHHLKEAGDIDNMQMLMSKYDLPQYISTAFIEEAGPSAEEIIETPLSEKSIKIVPEIIFCLRATWINSQLYPLDNKTRVDSIENLYKYIEAILKNDPTLTVTVSGGGEILFNGQPISRKRVNMIVLRGLASLFYDYGINSITFKRGMTKRELDSLFLLLSEKAEYFDDIGGFAKLLKEKAIANIKIDEVRYRKASDMSLRSRGVGELFKKMMPASSAIRNFFSIEKEGLTVNKEILSDSKKAIDSMLKVMTAISEQEDSEDNKSIMILEGLYKTMDGLSKKDISLNDEKIRLGEAFLSLEPLLRTKTIKESIRHGEDSSNFVLDILAGLDKKSIIKILNDGKNSAQIPPGEFADFLKAVAKSQSLKDSSYKEVQNLFSEAGIGKEITKKALDDVFIKSFFDKIAKEVIESDKSKTLDKKTIDNLEPLTEALIIKGDTEAIEKLSKSLLARVRTTSISARIAAIKAIDRVLEVLLNKEIFKTSIDISTELSACAKAEDNVNAYVEFLKVLEMTINKLLQKQNSALLSAPLTALKEGSGRESAEFSSLAQETINRILKMENIDLLLSSLKGKAEKEYSVIIDLLAGFGEKMLNPLLKLVCKEDDIRLDPFDIYMKKRQIAFVVKRLGQDAILKLKDLLKDKRPFVVKNTIQVFANMDDEKYLSFVEEATHHPDTEVQKEARNLVKKLKQRKE